ncbi:hypothetical protein [Oligoflexus tunisiensis]|uniref:hypothetical protein n=1 Tax=Oligoflexus tunisiensis TaxID=708132 RepID=UPI001C403A95|nr:hypothetical protein [Oligoflexus tunisiensis]
MLLLLRQVFGLSYLQTACQTQGNAATSVAVLYQNRCRRVATGLFGTTFAFMRKRVQPFKDERAAVIMGSTIRYTLEMMLAAILTLAAMMSIAVLVTIVVLLSGAALITMAVMSMAG